MAEFRAKKEELAGWFLLLKSVIGKVFAIVRALDTMSKSASPSECITLILEADN